MFFTKSSLLLAIARGGLFQVQTAAACSRVIHCHNGMAYNNRNGAVFSGPKLKTCEADCNGLCCVSNSNASSRDACTSGSFSVCADGSCNGYNACDMLGKDGNVGTVSGPSCVGNYACEGAGQNGGTVGDITNSCRELDACHDLGGSNGFVGHVSNACRGVNACKYVANGNTQFGYNTVLDNCCSGANACANAGCSSSFCYPWPAGTCPTVIAPTGKPTAFPTRFPTKSPTRLPTDSDDILVTIGSSGNQSKEITVDNLTNYRCPPIVNKSNWDREACGDLCEVGDTFEVSVSGNKLTVLRSDANDWGINLAFHCFFIGTTAPSMGLTGSPSAPPSDVPSKSTSVSPSIVPSNRPSKLLSGSPSVDLTGSPSSLPSDAPLKSTSVAPSVVPQFHVVCGKGTGCAEGNQRPAHAAEKHAVRCCADEKRGNGWKKQDNCNVWAYSITPHCHKDSFAKAMQICDDVGARLCTKDQLANRCTITTGCGFDHVLVWSSSPVTEPSAAPTDLTCAAQQDLQELREEVKELRALVSSIHEILVLPRSPSCSPSATPNAEPPTNCPMFGTVTLNGEPATECNTCEDCYECPNACERDAVTPSCGNPCCDGSELDETNSCRPMSSATPSADPSTSPSGKQSGSPSAPPSKNCPMLGNIVTLNGEPATECNECEMCMECENACEREASGPSCGLPCCDGSHLDETNSCRPSPVDPPTECPMLSNIVTLNGEPATECNTCEDCYECENACERDAVTPSCGTNPCCDGSELDETNSCRPM